MSKDYDIVNAWINPGSYGYRGLTYNGKFNGREYLLNELSLEEIMEEEYKKIGEENKGIKEEDSYHLSDNNPDQIM